MKNLLLLGLVTLVGLMSVQAQQTQPHALRLYRLNDQIILADSLGNNASSYPYSSVSVGAYNARIRVSIDNGDMYFRPDQLLNNLGTAYGSSVNTSLAAYLLTLPSGGGGGSGGTTSVAATPGFITSSASGSIASGAYFISIANTGSAAGTVSSVSLPAGATLTYPAVTGTTYSAVTYNATGTTFLIAVTR